MSEFGFLNAKGDVYLTRCPRCERENWAGSVATGRCCWCGYVGKPEDVE